MAIGFQLLSGLYGLGVAARNWAYDAKLLSQHSVTTPVICVGNVTAGGTGKTPFVRWLVQSLIDQGKKPGILLRGYRGNYSGVRKVEPGDSVSLVGDEAVLYAEWFKETVPVVVSRKRIFGAELLEKLGVTHVVMDDGFQHRGLKRDLNLLLLDVSSEDKVDEWQRGKLLPAGRLRESLSSALSRASAVVYVDKGEIARDGDTPRDKPSGFSGPAFTFKLRTELPKHVAAGASVVATCAIGSPQPFFDNLKGQGLVLKQEAAYPDHYSFTKRDWDELRKAGFPIVCTEKDAVKLRSFVTGDADLIVAGQTGEFISGEQKSEFLKLIK